MSYDRVRVPPNPKYVAEIIVLRSSLGAKRKERHAGRAVLDLLENKRVHCKVIDLNTDARAGFEDGENEALQKLKDLGRLNKEGEGDLLLPLVFIDGWKVGNNYDLQDLEDDGVLGRILRREVCVKCFEKKDRCMMNCFACKSKFVQIIVDNKPIEALLSDYYDRVYTSGDLQEEDEGSEGDSDLRYQEFEAERNRQKPKAEPAAPKARPKYVPRKSVSRQFSEKRALFEGMGREPSLRMDKKASILMGRKPSIRIISIVPTPEDAAAPTLAEVPEEEDEDDDLEPLEEDDPPRMPVSVADFLAEHEGGLRGSYEEDDEEGSFRAGEAMIDMSMTSGPSSLEMARRMVLKSIMTRQQILKPGLARTRRATKRSAVLEELPMLSGHMWKKSPNPYRMRSFQWRFFVIKEAQIVWFKYKEEAEKGDALCNGFINLRAGPVEVVLDSDNDTTFSLRPLRGTWEDGAIGKGDTGKAFTFDTTKSEHTRARWARDIAEHVRRLHGQ